MFPHTNSHSPIHGGYHNHQMLHVRDSVQKVRCGPEHNKVRISFNLFIFSYLERFPFVKSQLGKYLTLKESTRVGSQNLSRSVFLEVSQERIPGGHPGMHSWFVSRNTIFEKCKTVKSFMKRRETNFDTMFLF